MVIVMTKIFLLTAPFDEDAKTGDGQYARSLAYGFADHYKDISCTWLKRVDGRYTIPFPTGTTSIPDNTIPSAIVLQPVANGEMCISGYKLDSCESSTEEAQKENIATVSPRTPKVIIKHDGYMHSLTIMDIYSQTPIELTEEKIDSLLDDLKLKIEKIEEAYTANIKANAVLKKTVFENIPMLVEIYNENNDEIQKYCSLNAYIERHIYPEKFIARYRKPIKAFEELKSQFSETFDANKLEKIIKIFNGLNNGSYPYDFNTKSLTYDLENELWLFEGIKKHIEIASNAVLIEVAARYPYSFEELTQANASQEEKLKIINLIYQDGFQGTHDKTTFINILLIGQAISSNKKSNVDKIKELQAIMINKQEPYLSANKLLHGFYQKKEFSNSDGFALAYKASRNDPIKQNMISTLISSMGTIDKDTYLDIHIRPPDCGVFISPEDIKKFQEYGIKVNITIHEYKQNYTRRYLQQYTHDLMRQANSVLFFNERDRDSAILASKYGDCDKRNTDEESGVAKKVREVGKDFELEKFPIQKYDLESKSKLTVASQKLSNEPSHIKDILEKKPNIISFGTIRPGKGFEEALKLAQLIKAQSSAIRGKISNLPIVKIAGDPQDKILMEKIVIERFGDDAYYKLIKKSYYLYKDSFTSQQRRDYWNDLIEKLNESEEIKNPYLEIHGWCKDHELLELKKSCKYVCRLDDMGMRNNGSAIISVLDVGIVYAKFGCVTDDIYIKAEGGEYGEAVDIGDCRYGIHSLEKSTKLPPLFIKKDRRLDIKAERYKREPYSRDPQEILDSIIEREQNQLECMSRIEESLNYKTVMQAQKLLTERFTLKKPVDYLLNILGLGSLIKSEIIRDSLEEIDPVAVIKPFEIPDTEVKSFGPDKISGNIISSIGLFMGKKLSDNNWFKSMIGAGVGALIGTIIFPALGTLIGAVVGGFMGGTTSFVIAKLVDKLKYLVQNQTQEKFSRKKVTQDDLQNLESGSENVSKGSYNRALRILDRMPVRSKSSVREALIIAKVGAPLLEPIPEVIDEDRQCYSFRK